MSERHGPDGESTMRTVRQRADGYQEELPRFYSGSAMAIPEIPEHIARPMSMVVGLGIGALLLLLAGVTFVAMGSWSEIGRTGAVTAYGVTAFFLAIAGLGCTFGTLNHHLNVLRKDAPHHH